MPLPQAGEQMQDLGFDGDVQRGGRLIQDEQLRLACQRRGDQRPLPHPAAQLVRVGARDLGRAGDADLGQQVDRLAQRGGRTDPHVLHQRFGDLAADAQGRIEGGERILEHAADEAAQDRPAAGGRQ